MLTNADILKIAIEQSAIDCSCKPDDFLNGKKNIVISNEDSNARCYLELPHHCYLVSYGSGIVASVRESVLQAVEQYLDSGVDYACFEPPNTLQLNDILQPFGLRLASVAEYFLPDVEKLHVRKTSYDTRLIYPDEFEPLYLPEWSNALCEKRKELDRLAIGAFDGKKLIGLAGCSADCETMYQIGIDVLPDYRRQGIASALTSRLAVETLRLGKVPFYCAAWSNLRSVRNALCCGFRPAWIELCTKSI